MLRCDARGTDVYNGSRTWRWRSSGLPAADPELDRYLTETIASVNLQIRRVLDVYRDRGWLRDDVPFDELVETTAVLASVETYLQITHRDGWSVAAYRTWLRRMLAETVFVSPEPTTVRSVK